MKNKMLIPKVAEREGWRKYFRIDIVRALGYSQRILGLYNRVSTDSSNILVKKMVIGVIGRDTIGHWKDIQDLYLKMFGIKCIKCEEAVKRIAIGIPFENVVEAVTLSFTSSWELLEDIKTISTILSSVISNVKNIDKVVPQEETIDDIDSLVRKLSSNPLEIIKLIKGFYSTLISLLPLYNEYTYFLYITRTIPDTTIKDFFPSLSLDKLNEIGIKYSYVNVCRDEGSLIVYSADSVAHYIAMYVETLYQFIKKSLRLSLSKYFKLVDEEQRYLITMVREASRIGEEMANRVKDARRRILNIIRLNSVIRRHGQDYICSDTNIIFHRSSCQVTIGSANTTYTEFVEGLTPYILTGLVTLKDIQVKDRDVVKARMRIYYSLKDLEQKPS